MGWVRPCGMGDDGRVVSNQNEENLLSELPELLHAENHRCTITEETVPNAPSAVLELTGMLLHMLGVGEGCALQRGALWRGSFLQNLWGIQTSMCTNKTLYKDCHHCAEPGVVPGLAALLIAN